MTTASNPLNAAHGHESPAHRSTKLEWSAALRRVGFHLVFFEQGSDLLAVKAFKGAPWPLAIEGEFSSRNLFPNINRNFNAGCKGEIICCPDFETAAAICRKLARELPPEFRGKVGVTTIQTLRLLFPEHQPNNHINSPDK